MFQLRENTKIDSSYLRVPFCSLVKDSDICSFRDCYILLTVRRTFFKKTNIHICLCPEIPFMNIFRNNLLSLD